MSPNACNVLTVGVGGQGILLLSNVLSEAAFLAGHDVKKSEIHGMSQRGGSVTSHVRWGERVHAPVIMDGDADVIIALEELEALRYAHILKPGGCFLVNDFRALPASVVSGKARYPEDIDGRLGAYGRVERIQAQTIATTVGEARASNMVLLGALARQLSFAESIWTAAIARHVRERFRDANLRAFQAGRAGQPG